VHSISRLSSTTAAGGGWLVAVLLESGDIYLVERPPGGAIRSPLLIHNPDGLGRLAAETKPLGAGGDQARALQIVGVNDGGASLRPGILSLKGQAPAFAFDVATTVS